jgi:hypothetical protein
MKFIVYKVSGQKKSRRFKFDMEKALVISFVVVMVIMICVQAILATPHLRTLIVRDIEFEGTPVSAQEYLYKEGEITLELMNKSLDQGLKVLKNGDEAADFSNNNVILTVKEGDVIEIDGTDSLGESVVSVKSCSENIDMSCIGKNITVDSEVKSLIKIKME